MTLAPTYVLNAVSLLAIVLQLLNIEVAPEALQTWVTVSLIIATPVFSMFRQWWTGRSTLAGTRPK